MTFAWQRAKATWESENPGKSFELLLGRYIAEGGVVWSCATQFLLACPVLVQQEGRVVHDPVHADTWLIHLAALATERCSPTGVLAAFMKLAPYPLRWVAWHRRRRDRLHRHAWTDLAGRISSHYAVEIYEHIC